MSRIYEALQRADLERKAAQGSENHQVPEPVFEIDAAEPALATDFAEPTFAPEVEPQPPAVTYSVLDGIARYPWKPVLPYFPTLAERNAGIEQFRSLRSHVYQARHDAPLKTILISSGLPEEGKSFIAANLAMSLARNSVNSILLIDGDLRRPTLHKLLGAPDTPGLSEYLEGKAELTEIMQRDLSSKSTEAPATRSLSPLTFIPAGKSGDNASELAANKRIKELVATLSPHFDWILIDSPPVLAVTDAVDLASAADAVLLVARGASTPFDVAQRTQAAFSKSRILGYVLNAVKETPHTGSYYYYSAQEDGGEAKPRKDKKKKG
jgi:capsular exopolysaccharide synthesis family protein